MLLCVLYSTSVPHTGTRGGGGDRWSSIFCLPGLPANMVPARLRLPPLSAIRSFFWKLFLRTGRFFTSSTKRSQEGLKLSIKKSSLFGRGRDTCSAPQVETQLVSPRFKSLLCECFTAPCPHLFPNYY